MTQPTPPVPVPEPPPAGSVDDPSAGAGRATSTPADPGSPLESQLEVALAGVPATPPAEKLVGAERVLAVLLELARHPEGLSLEEAARAVDSPKPTVHRALGQLRRAGLARQESHGRYLLGDEFLRLAFAFHEARPEEVRVRPLLEALQERFGETVHYAVLDGHEVVYRSKVDPTAGAVRLTSTIGGRNPAHATAVGKLLLSYRLPDADAVRRWVGTRELERRTDRTLCTADALAAGLDEVRARGYAVDDEENEPGIACLALPVHLGPSSGPSGAVSVSALAYRTPLTTLVGAVDEIRAVLAGPAPDHATPRRIP